MTSNNNVRPDLRVLNNLTEKIYVFIINFFTSNRIERLFCRPSIKGNSGFSAMKIYRVSQKIAISKKGAQLTIIDIFFGTPGTFK